MHGLIRRDPSHARSPSYSRPCGNREAVTPLSQTGEKSLMWSDCSSCLHFSFARRGRCGSPLTLAQSFVQFPSLGFHSAMQIDSGGRDESRENHGVMHKQTGHLHRRDVYKPCKYSLEKKGEKGCGCESLFFFFRRIRQKCRSSWQDFLFLICC